MQNYNNDNAKNNIIIGPDYSHLIKQNTNGAILEAFVSFILSKNANFDILSILRMFKTVVLIIFIKMLIEDTKSVIDKFKITDLRSIRYLYQRFRYSEIRRDINLVNGKWVHNLQTMSFNALSVTLEQKQVFVSRSGDYYFNYLSYLIKVSSTSDKITFFFSNVTLVERYIDDIIINKNKEITMGGKTVIQKAVFQNHTSIKFEPTQLSHALPTNNYINMKDIIKRNVLINSYFVLSSTPLTAIFDGEPGTGKTTFASYIAGFDIFDRIIICNLVSATKNSFNDIIVHLDRQLSTFVDKSKKEVVLLIFDEIDKWLNSYLDYRIDIFREESRKKISLKDGVQKQNSTIEYFEKLTQQEEAEKRIQMKNEFFDSLYKLINGDFFSDQRRYVMIFNTNNFSTIFDNVDDRYQAVKDRFHYYKFNRMNKSDVINYLKNIAEFLIKSNEINKTYNNEKDTIDIEIFNESIYDNIPDNIEITYRTLFKILCKNQYFIQKTVDELATISDFKSLNI